MKIFQERLPDCGAQEQKRKRTPCVLHPRQQVNEFFLLLYIIYLGGGWRAAVMTWRKTMHMPRQKEPQWVLLPFWSDCSDICPIQYLTRPDKITLEHSDRPPRRGKIHSDCKSKLPSLPPSQTGWHWQKVSSINTSSSNLTKLWLWTASDTLQCTVS